MSTGIYLNKKAKDYFAIEALSASGLKYLAQSPAHYRITKDNPPEPTPAMRIGSAIHALKHGDQQVLGAPCASRAAKAYKEMAEANPGAIVLLEEEVENTKRVVDALESHPLVKGLYKNGKVEVSGFWTDPETGIPCKARADFLRDDDVIIDLKTTTDASRHGFERSIMNFKYHWQSAWYLDGFGALLGKTLQNFVHIVVEKEAPYGIGVYVLDDGSLEKAREDIRKLKQIYADCLHTGEWPGYSVEIQNIGLPAYAFSQEVA